MLTGDQLFQARTSAGMTQQQLANTLGVSLRSVGNWERAEQVPRSAEAKVWKLLGNYLLEDQHPAVSSDLAHVSDARLLAEIARRFELGRREVGSDDSSAPTSKPDIVRTQNVTVELDDETTQKAARRGVVAPNELDAAGEESQGEAPDGGA